MSFSKAQQGHYRPLVEQAWARFCQAQRIDPVPPYDDKTAICRAWYEDELEIATGHRSSVDCDMKRDFEDAMVHFEWLVGDSTYWADRLYGADARRIAFCIREVVRENEVDEDYMRRIARRAAGLGVNDPLPDLSKFTYEQLLTIMGELKRFLRRGGTPGQRRARSARPTFVPEPEMEMPF